MYTLEGPRPKPTGAQWWGIFGHRFLEHAVTKSREYALNYLTLKCRSKKLIYICSRIDTDALPQDGHFEKGYAYNVVTEESRELPRMNWRLKEGEQYTRIDCEVNEHGELHLIDFKFYDVSEEDPRDPQLLGHGLSALRAYTDPWGITPQGVAKPDFVRISLCGVLPDGSLVWRSVRLFESDLSRFAAVARQIHEQVLLSRRRYDSGEQLPRFSRGPACNWCDLKAVCPEWAPAAGGDARHAAGG